MSGRDERKTSARIDFCFIYARLMTACGYTPSEIDEMTLHDVLDLFAYWRDSPPAHEILKWAYRVEPKSTGARTKSDTDPSGIGGLIKRFPEGFVRARDGV